MFDNILNLIIIFIPLAIFIGRVVTRARSKHHPPPKVPQPYIPVHFEDDDEDDSDYFKNLAAQGSSPQLATAKPQTAAKPQARPGQRPLTSQLLGNIDSPLVRGAAAGKKPVKETVAAPREGFALNLNHLSPLKQAVVMAEILGPPKGMIF